MAESFNRTIREMTCAKLLSADVTSAFWAEALSVAVYINNRSSTKANEGRTPSELWTGRNPQLSHLHPFGSLEDLLKPPHQRNKLSSRSSEGLYLGPAGDTSLHHIWVKASRTVTVSRDVIFIKHAIKLFQLDCGEPIVTVQPALPLQAAQDLNDTHILMGLDNTFNDIGTIRTRNSPHLTCLLLDGPGTTSPLNLQEVPPGIPMPKLS